MPNVRKEPEQESGMKRAADMADSFLAVPGYADDSMLSVIRYVSKVNVSQANALASTGSFRPVANKPGRHHQSSLRKCDFDEFMHELSEMDKAANHTPAETPAARVEKIREHRTKARGKLEEFPELAAGFDQFLASTKALHRQQKGAAKQEEGSSSEATSSTGKGS